MKKKLAVLFLVALKSMKVLHYVSISALLLFFSCSKEEVDPPAPVASDYPKYFKFSSSEIQDFSVYNGSPNGAKEATANYSPDDIWGYRLSIPPKSITLYSDSILSFDNNIKKCYKFKGDSILVKETNESWSNIACMKSDKLIYHVALIYIYRRPYEGAQTLSIENSYQVFNYDLFFKTYPLTPSELLSSLEKIAWCNIYATYDCTIMLY